jgi:hypothetical protein
MENLLGEAGFRDDGGEVDPFLDDEPLKSGGDWRARFALGRSDPVLGLLLLVAAGFGLERWLHHVALAHGAPLVVLSFAYLLLAGLLLRAAVSRYLYARTQLAAFALAALPVAYLLAADHSPPFPEDHFAERAELTAVAEALGGIREDTLRLEGELSEARAVIVTQAEEIHELRLVANRPVPTVETAPAEDTAAAEPEAVEPVMELAPRLATLGPRIARIGPSTRPQVATAPDRVDEDLFLLASHIGANARLRARMMRDEDLQQCLATRRGGRGFFQRLGHRLDREAYAEYLRPCVPGPMLAMAGGRAPN